jgi:hypothetical protein
VTDLWFTVDINPDPWAIGPLSMGKKNGKFFPIVGQNAQLANFKAAVAESLEGITPMGTGEYDLHFWFWRRLDGTGRNKKHVSDATNLQKATEDALQGVLFDNDRNVRRISSEVVEQGPDVRPMIVIRARLYTGLNPDEIPPHIWEQIDRLEDEPNLFDNSWGGPQ